MITLVYSKRVSVRNNLLHSVHEVLSPFRICLRLQKPVAYLIGKITKHKQMTSVPIKATFTKGASIFGHKGVHTFEM